MLLFTFHHDVTLLNLTYNKCMACVMMTMNYKRISPVTGPRLYSSQWPQCKFCLHAILIKEKQTDLPQFHSRPLGVNIQHMNKLVLLTRINVKVIAILPND